MYPTPPMDNGMVAAVMAQLRIAPEQFATPFAVLANPATHALLPVGFNANAWDRARTNSRPVLMARRHPLPSLQRAMKARPRLSRSSQ